MSQSAVPTKPVVTLFEQYGAGADYIGPKLAERFGVQYVGYRWSSEELEQLHATPAEEQTAFDRFMVAAGRGVGRRRVPWRPGGPAPDRRRSPHGGLQVGRVAGAARHAWAQRASHWRESPARACERT